MGIDLETLCDLEAIHQHCAQGDGLMDKPDWWPLNPYPESVWPMQMSDISEIIRNPDELTAVSGSMGRHFWDIASDDILEALGYETESINRQRDETQAALRAIVDAIEREDAPAFRDSHYSDEDLSLLVRARDVLREGG